MSGLHKVMLKAGGLPRFRGLAQVMMLMMMGQRVVAVGKAVQLQMRRNRE